MIGYLDMVDRIYPDTKQHREFYHHWISERPSTNITVGNYGNFDLASPRTSYLRSYPYQRILFSNLQSRFQCFWQPFVRGYKLLTRWNYPSRFSWQVSDGDIKLSLTVLSAISVSIPSPWLFIFGPRLSIFNPVWLRFWNKTKTRTVGKLKVEWQISYFLSRFVILWIFNTVFLG